MKLLISSRLTPILKIAITFLISPEPLTNLACSCVYHEDREVLDL